MPRFERDNKRNRGNNSLLLLYCLRQWVMGTVTRAEVRRFIQNTTRIYSAIFFRAHLPATAMINIPTKKQELPQIHFLGG
ncbi:hypothetical protein B2M27_26065 [Kluyvera intermedia]|uniref:Uncharacterized protein n=2 Tax=Enterobacteriaceae TaxID=543 RepID=A0AAC8QN58_9ENTR|nr:hypothetical protein AB182_11145 [Phytobacter ursingii]ORJ47431.1 hypothetical protein B2M27_26065 [Kluyvera intermedia]